MTTSKRARERYATFWNCLMQLSGALGDAQKLAAHVDDSVRTPAWVATSADIRKSVRRADGALGTLTRNSKKWEAELVSREWRK